MTPEKDPKDKANLLPYDGTDNLKRKKKVRQTIQQKGIEALQEALERAVGKDDDVRRRTA